MSETCDEKFDHGREVKRDYEWLNKSKSASRERTRYYTELYSKCERGKVDSDVKSSMQKPAETVKEKQTLHDYLIGAFDNNEKMAFRALSGLQLQGYQVDFLPAGHQIEVSEGELSIFKMEGDEKIYYKSPQTDKEVKKLDLLAAIPKVSTAYYASGSYSRFTRARSARNKIEGRKMIRNATKDGRFVRITGSVNGVKYRDSVRVVGRHVLAAQEMVYLLDNVPNIFDQNSINWMNKNGNLDLLRSLANRDRAMMRKMNHRGTDEFKRARSADGLLQLTLAWRRIRSVLPKDVVRAIRKGDLDAKKFSFVQMRLVQTNAVKGKDVVADRNVSVESLLLKDEIKPAKRVVAARKPVKSGRRPPRAVPDDKKDGGSAETVPEETPKEAPTEKKSPAEKSWSRESRVLNYLVGQYPEISTEIENESPTVKVVNLVFKSKGLPTIRKRARVILPSESGEKAKFEMNGAKNPKDFGDIMKTMVDDVKAKIEEPVVNEMEDLLGAAKTTISDNENLDAVIGNFRSRYSKGSLKLKVLLTRSTQIKPKGATGGAVGSKFLKLVFRKRKGEIGIAISGGSMEKGFFYSLESNRKDEIELF